MTICRLSGNLGSIVEFSSKANTISDIAAGNDWASVCKNSENGSEYSALTDLSGSEMFPVEVEPKISRLEEL